MNKATITYERFWQLSIAAFLAVMLTLAPCSVRNSIEQSLGLEKTTVANKSKSAEVKSAYCLSITVGNSKNLPKANYQSFDAVLPDEGRNSLAYQTISIKHFSRISYIGEVVRIPFYILYSSFKYHL